MKPISRFAASAALLALSAAGCRTVPITGRTQFIFTSPESENAEGAAAYEEYKGQFQRTKNERQQEVLQRVGDAIRTAAGEDAAGFDWEFNVFETKTVNAYCYAGGKVAVLTGIMPKFANEAEMACVVAHEVGHAIARHGGERESWSMLKGVGTLGFSLWGSSQAQTIYGLGTHFGVTLPYSRSNESEADLIGLRLMARAGYDPRAAVAFWRKFGTGNSTILDELFATHPCDATRVDDLSAHMTEAEEEYRKAPVKRGLGVKFLNGIPAEDKEED